MVENACQLVRYVLTHPGIELSALAEHYGVSERSIRSYVKQANEQIGDFAHLGKKKRGGYIVEVSDGRALDEWLDSIQKQHDRANMTPDDRVAYLINDLLERTDWIKVNELCRDLHVSRPTISADLKQAEEKLSSFGLSVERRPCYGIRVTGDEMARRLCLASSVIESLAAPNVTKRSRSSGGYPGLVPLNQISELVDAALDEHDFKVCSPSYQNLLVHISIALSRIRSGNFIPTVPKGRGRSRNDRALEVARDIAALIEDRLGIQIPESECAYIAIHLAGKESLGLLLPPPENESEDRQNLVITDEVWDVASRMIEAVWASFRYDFRGDLELHMNLACHIVPLAVRLHYHMGVGNPLISDIRKRYPLAYSMALESSVVLAEHYCATLSENEAGYIALSFALALERNRTSRAKKNILVVCTSGRALARMLGRRYLEEFGAYVASVQTCDVSHVDKVDFSDIDYVFTTVPINKPLPVPVCEVKFFLDDPEVSRVRRMLRESVEGVLGPGLATRFPPGLFFTHCAFPSKKAALAFLCEKVQATGLVPDNLLEIVMRHEGYVDTSLGPNVAMPHPLEPVCERAFVAVALLDEPVDWGMSPVQAIFMVLTSDEDNDELGGMFDALAYLFVDAGAIDELLADQRRERLTGLLGSHTTSEGGRSPPGP